MRTLDRANVQSRIVGLKTDFRDVGWGLRTRRWSATFLLVCCVCGNLRDAFAQQEGDEVVPKSDAQLKVEREIVATVTPDDVLVVEQLQGDWLWVRTASEKRGWIKKDRVAVYDATPPAPTAIVPNNPPVPDPVEPTPADTEPVQPAKPVDPEADRLYLIGALGGSHVYTTYAYIGVLADGLSKDVYSTAQVKELLGETIAISQSLEQHLRQVAQGDLAQSDQAAIDTMIAIYVLLQDEARAVIKFTDSRANEDAAEFDRLRTTVWPKIAGLLGLEDPAGADNAAK